MSVVIPFPANRFTKDDVAEFANLCYRMTGEGLAGGWSRQVGANGADLLSILNAEDDFPKYTFWREPDGQYFVVDSSGSTVGIGNSIGEVLAELAPLPGRSATG